MRRFMQMALSGLLLVVSLAPATTLADSREHHRAMKLCKQHYKDAVRGAKYLRGHQRRLRMEQARQDRAECESLAPR